MENAMNTTEDISQMAQTKRANSRNEILKAAEQCNAQQEDANLAIPTHRKTQHISFDKYKALLEGGKTVPEIIAITSKHLVAFYNAMLKGKINLSKEDFERMYLNGISLDEISSKTGTPREYVTYLREFYGIKRKGATYLKRIREEQPLSQDTKNLLIGSVLGDGHITPLGYFSEKHSEKQVAYLEWKAGFLGAIMGAKAFDAETSFDKRSGSKIYSFSVRTKAHSFLYELREKFYKRVNGEWTKTIPKDFACMLDARILSIWFMDDGSTDWHYRNGDKATPGMRAQCKLSTQSFSIRDQQIVVDALSKNFGIHASITPVSGKPHLRFLRFSTEDSAKLISIVKGFCIPSLLYKVDESAYVAKENSKHLVDKEAITKAFLLNHNINLRERNDIV